MYVIFLCIIGYEIFFEKNLFSFSNEFNNKKNLNNGFIVLIFILDLAASIQVHDESVEPPHFPRSTLPHLPFSCLRYNFILHLIWNLLYKWLSLFQLPWVWQQFYILLYPFLENSALVSTSLLKNELVKCSYRVAIEVITVLHQIAICAYEFFPSLKSHYWPQPRSKNSFISY